ncbi:putative RNA-directed DNA polymerase, partial [Tanacetum coccineum]
MMSRGVRGAVRFGLPSFVLIGKSSFELVYGFKPKLSHLRSFRCLYFSSILNNSDKFSARSEKCVLISFSTTKKAYKVYSLESKLISYSRDVNETVSPFKMNSSLEQNYHILKDSFDNDLNNIIFFNEHKFDSQTSFRPYDDERGTSTPNDDGNDQPCTRSSDTSDVNEVDFATSIGDNPSSEGNVPSFSNLNSQRDLPENISQEQHSIRKSSRLVKMSAKFNDYVVGSSRKYGLEKYVSYSNLSKHNYFLSTTLNKSTEPNTYYKAIQNHNWIEAMNNEIEALNMNNTWTICDLPEGRKSVGSKWLFKIKYKSTGSIKRYKAMLVAKGFSQREGSDYMETFSLVVKMSTVRCCQDRDPTQDRFRLCKIEII